MTDEENKMIKKWYPLLEGTPERMWLSSAKALENTQKAFIEADEKRKEEKLRKTKKSYK